MARKLGSRDKKKRKRKRRDLSNLTDAEIVGIGALGALGAITIKTLITRKANSSKESELIKSAKDYYKSKRIIRKPKGLSLAERKRINSSSIETKRKRFLNAVYDPETLKAVEEAQGVRSRQGKKGINRSKQRARRIITKKSGYKDTFNSYAYRKLYK